MRIVHLARDEKFIPLMRELFEVAFPGSNHWLIARRSRAALRFVAPGPMVRDRAEWWFRTPLIRRDVAGADVIVAHSMTTIFANAIKHAPAGTRVAWLGWGYEYYPLLAAELGPTLLPKTRALVGVDDEATPEKSKALIAIAPRLLSFSVTPYEAPLLQRALPGLRAAVHHELPLFTTEDVFERGPATMVGIDVLVGNSAAASNNHLEAFELLRGRVEGRVVVPLSYGNMAYGKQIAQEGARVFGERFDPLTQWMPIDAYNQRIGSCGFVVMNHRRQQAVGNIGAALFKGATVYLRPENPLFDFYRDLGIHMHSTEDLAEGTGLLAPLTDAQRADNRARIGAYYARARVVQAIRDLPPFCA